MDNENTETVEQIDPAAEADLALQRAIDMRETNRTNDLKLKMAALIGAGSESREEANKQVRAAADAVAPAPESQRATPAFGGIRAVPAHLSDYRYRTLSGYQRGLRTPDQDWAVGQYFKGLAQSRNGSDNFDQGALLQRVMGQDKEYRRARADLLEGVLSGGTFNGTAGQALPLPVANYIMEAFHRQARVRNLARTFTSPSASIRVPLQDAVSTSGFVAEADTIPGGEPTASDQITLVKNGLKTLATLSNELLEDEQVFGLVSWLLEQVTSEMAASEDVFLWQTGTGTLQPAAMELADTLSGTTPTNFVPTLTQVANFDLTTLIDYAHVVKMFYSLPEKERRNAVWAGNDQVMSALSQINSDTNTPLFQNRNDPAQLVGDMESGASITTMLGKRVWNLPGKEAALGSASDGDDNRLYFGTMDRMYAVLESGSVSVSVSTDAQHADDTTQYRFVRRVDGQPMTTPISGRFHYVFTGGINGAGTPIA